MKTIFSLLLLIGFAKNPNLTDIRKVYPSAAETENSANEFASKMAGIDAGDDKTLLAYKGASLAMKSKFRKKISEKISILKEGGKMIEAAVAADSDNVEIRMIRLSIQENLPAITNYKKNIAEDKAFVLKHYGQQPDALKTYLKNFIRQSKSFSDKEKQAAK